MRLIILLSVFLCAYFYSGAQVTNKDYDSVLAKRLNGNDNGMKRYYLVMLKSGPVVITEKAQRDSIFSGHMNNIQSLASQNKLVVAGPLGKNDKEYRGIFILNTDSKEEAEKMVETDPAVQAKVFVAEYYPWFGSAALQETLEIHKKITKSEFSITLPKQECPPYRGHSHTIVYIIYCLLFTWPLGNVIVPSGDTLLPSGSFLSCG